MTFCSILLRIFCPYFIFVLPWAQARLSSLCNSQKIIQINRQQSDLSHACSIQIVCPDLMQSSCYWSWIYVVVIVLICNIKYFVLSFNHVSLNFSVYADGSICLDILQNQWSPIYDVAAILTSIQVWPLIIFSLDPFLLNRTHFTGLVSEFENSCYLGTSFHMWVCVCISWFCSPPLVGY